MHDSPVKINLTLNEKSRIDNSRTECVKDVKIYFIGLKKTCLVDFRIEEIREKYNETGLKEEGVIEMSIYSAFHIRDARSLSL